MNDCLKEPAFYVGDIDAYIDLNLLPSSGEDYIKRVVIEAKTCERVMVANIEESKLKRPTVNVKQPEINNRRGWIDLCSAELLEGSQICPTLGTVLSMNHPMVEQVLEYLVEFIERKERLPSKLGQWVYALLVILEQPINPEVCSCLRKLARTCAIIRANMVHILLNVMRLTDGVSTGSSLIYTSPKDYSSIEKWLSEILTTYSVCHITLKDSH